MNTNLKKYFNFDYKFFLALSLCLFARLIPVRVPNVEPILATLMPVGRVYGLFAGMFFAAVSILLYDAITLTFGVHTFFTLGAYLVLGVWSFHYFKGKQGDAGDYVSFAIWGTLFFDAATGLTVGPLFHHQSFLSALSGQIPFTALHLLGNIIFAYLLSPAVYKFFIKKKEIIKSESMIETLNPKII